MYVHDYQYNLEINFIWLISYLMRKSKPVLWIPDTSGSIVLSVNKTPAFIHCELGSEFIAFVCVSFVEYNGSKSYRRAIVSKSVAEMKSK